MTELNTSDLNRLLERKGFPLLEWEIGKTYDVFEGMWICVNRTGDSVFVVPETHYLAGLIKRPPFIITLPVVAVKGREELIHGVPASREIFLVSASLESFLAFIVRAQARKIKEITEANYDLWAALKKEIS